MRNLLILLVLFICPTLALAQEATPEPEVFTFDGLERSYVLYEPDAVDEPAPLVLVLHSRFGDGQRMAEFTGFNEIAEREGFIAVYPDGLDGEWNYVRGIPGYPNTHDDTAFLIALVDHIAASYSVDLSRVYVTGFSNGGFMVQRVACENPTRFAAFASVAGAGFGGMRGVCLQPGIETAPMLLINGTADNNVLWEGTGFTRDGQTIYVTYPIPQTLAYWGEFNGCQAEAETSDVRPSGNSPDTSVRFLTLDCPADASVVLVGVIGGGHNWPGQEIDAPEIYGSVNRDIDVGEVIWEFFAAHQRPQDEEATPEAE